MSCECGAMSSSDCDDSEGAFDVEGRWDVYIPASCEALFDFVGGTVVFVVEVEGGHFDFSKSDAETDFPGSMESLRLVTDDFNESPLGEYLNCWRNSNRAAEIFIVLVLGDFAASFTGLAVKNFPRTRSGLNG